MSHFNEIEIDCPKCTEDFPAVVWTSIHVKEDPELKDLLLGGELNILDCPRCGHQFYYESFLIYQDPAEQIIAYVHPEAQQTEAESLRKMMLTGFQEALAGAPQKEQITYDPVLVFGLAELVEMINEDVARNEEADVAKVICQEKGIAVVKVPPAKARLREIPRLLPVAGEGPDRDRVLAGLEALLAINPALSLFNALRELIKKEPAWKLP